MGRNLNDILSELPLKRRAKADVAAAHNIKQPCVSKIEKRADMHLSTLRGYVEAMGGELDIVAPLPGQAPMRPLGFGDAAESAAPQTSITK